MLKGIKLEDADVCTCKHIHIHRHTNIHTYTLLVHYYGAEELPVRYKQH